jgi:hypothetical protein
MDREMETNYQGQTVLVVGAAHSGIASAEFLLARCAKSRKHPVSWSWSSEVTSPRASAGVTLWW